jgi:DNA-binding transcriptional MerR regulator
MTALLEAVRDTRRREEDSARFPPAGRRGERKAIRARQPAHRGDHVTGKTPQAAREAEPSAAVRTYEGGDTRSLALVASLAAAHRVRRGGGASGSGGSGGSSRRGLFSDEELRRLEEDHPEGLTAAQIVDLFSGRGLRFSEATFRKYVQLNLVPRSRRVGRKGKHRGSLGVYPAKAVRRINAVRRLMDDGRTIEEIQAELLRFGDVLENLEEGLTDLFHRFEAEIETPRFDSKAKKSLKRDLGEARRSADELLKRLDDLSHRVGKPPDETFGGTGAAGSAEELL